jgi:type IV pilus assembly protein PilX
MSTQAQYYPIGTGNDQKGVVLIIVLIMLGLLSMMATTSLHNAQSTESISGNTRTTQLASQAAEIALRHCEASVMMRMAIKSGDTTSATAQYTTSFTYANITPFESPPAWQDAAGQWDKSNPYVFVIPLSLMGDASLYKRAPECMVESISEQPSGTTQPAGTRNHFIITARGFGPEVASAGAKRLRPVGTEVWLQTHVSLAKDFQTLESRSWRQIFLR